MLSDPLRSSGPVLLLPDGHTKLELIDDVSAGFEAIAPVCARNRHCDRWFPHIEGTDTVDCGHLENRPLCIGLIDDFCDLRAGNLVVGLVFEATHARSSRGVIPDGSAEQHQAPSSRIGNELRKNLGVDRFGCDVDPNGFARR